MVLVQPENNSLVHLTISSLLVSFFNKIKRFYIHFKFENRKLKNNSMIRYIFKELFIYFAVMFLFYFLIFFVNNILVLMLKLLGKNLPLWDVLVLIFYSLPSIISQTAPFAILTGFLMCLGRMNSDNEILVLRVSGQNPRRIILIPVLVLGFIVSLFNLFINDYLLPISRIKFNEQYLVSISRNPFVEIEPNSVKKLNENTIVIGDIKDSIINDIVFFDKEEKNNQRIIISGNTVANTSNKDGLTMSLDMNDSFVVVLNRNKIDYNLLKSDKLQMNIFESSFVNYSNATAPDEMTSYDIYKEIKNIKKNYPDDKDRLNRFVLEFNKKFSLSFGALFFAFLAMPLSLIFGKQNGVFFGLITGVLISVLYWSLLWIFMLFGYRNGLNGFFAMWVPNFIVGIAGLFFYWLMIRK
mgnify:FL=1